MDTTGLMSVHTLFVREHNRIATFFSENTEWEAEQIYQETRRIVGAELQLITYNEDLPLLLSPKTVSNCFHRCFIFFFEFPTDFFSSFFRSETTISLCWKEHGISTVTTLMSMLKCLKPSLRRLTDLAIVWFKRSFYVLVSIALNTNVTMILSQSSIPSR